LPVFSSTPLRSLQEVVMGIAEVMAAEAATSASIESRSFYLPRVFIIPTRAKKLSFAPPIEALFTMIRRPPALS
jgi:hypothetical protein